jgi:hypothetical protein
LEIDMAVLVKNNAYSTLASTITDVATSISLAAGTGSRFPVISGGDYFYATLIDTSNNLEVVKVTARSTDTLTVVRAQDGTTARSYSSGSRIELRITAALIQDIRDGITPGDGTVTAAKLASNAVETAKIAADAVTFAKIQNIATARALGRSSALSGDVEEITASQLLDFLGATQGNVAYRGASGWVVLAPGTAVQALLSGGAAANVAWGKPSYAPDVIIQDQKTSGTDGGTFTNGADRTRTLNTLVRNLNSLASLSSNRFTLPAGTYFIEWSAPGYKVDHHQSLLYNVTDAVVVARGQGAFSNNSGDYCSSESSGCAVVTIAASKAFEIRHRCFATTSSVGFGRACSFGTEVYTTVNISKVLE